MTMAMKVVVKLIEVPSPPYYAPPQLHHGSSRPTIGFPLGTALLLIVVFALSGIFSCCYHWDKLRHLRGEFSDEDPDHDPHDSPSKPKNVQSANKQEEEGSLPVIMAGDQFVRFIAMPCPCEPPTQLKMTVEELQTPPKPPHIAIPMD